MKRFVNFPIRLKFMVTLLFLVTAVVSIITFTMATSFHDDKQSYINDWISIAAISTAEETRSLLQGYMEQLELSSLVMLDDRMGQENKAELLQRMFDSLPELIEVAVYRDGEVVEVATESIKLEQAGLTVDRLREQREASPLPLQEILAGQTYIRNATFSEGLPSFRLAFRQASEADDTPTVVSALLGLGELQALGARFQVFEIVLADAEGTLLAHPDMARVAAREPARLRAESRAVNESHRAGMTLEFSDNGVDMLGGFAGTDLGGVVAAAHMPKTAAYLASRALLGRLVAVAIGMLLVVAVAGRFWARRIVRPVEQLSRATGSIAEGAFDIQVDVNSRDEIGNLAGSFNKMAGELKTREEALKEAHAQLVQSEKLAAFGQLGAGIAHEVKNPLAGILGCAQLSLMELEEGTGMRKNLEIIEKETTRCKTIIDNLLKFARQERALLEPMDVNAVVEDSIAIVNHQLELNQVKVVREITPDLPLIHGNANQFQQVLMNLMINAQQAMEGEPGTVTVTTRPIEGERIEVVVGDDGPGIPEEIRSKLFEPFFTTKPTGKGTGLGLSVSFGIIRDHHGEIAVCSEVGEGTEFIIRVPVMKETPAADEAKTA